MRKIFKKKQQKVTNIQYDTTEKVENDISIVYLDNFKEIRQLKGFNTKADGISYMILKMKIDMKAVTTIKAYKLLFGALNNHCHYIDEDNSLLIMNSITNFNILIRTLENICKLENYDTSSCILCHQLKEFLEKLFNEDGRYDGLFQPTNITSLATLQESTDNCCDVINTFTYDYPNQKTCVILKMDATVIHWIENIIYYVYDHPFYWMKNIRIDVNKSYLIIEDINFVAHCFIHEYMDNIDDDFFKERFKQLSQMQQKVYNYFIGYLRQFDKTPQEDDEESENVDFSDIDEVIE